MHEISESVWVNVVIIALQQRQLESRRRAVKIGELASATHTSVETIRYYEREGLLPQAPRSEGNYRIYSPELVDRLGFVRHCRSLDMTLDEIRVLLHFKDSPGPDCAPVNSLLDDHIGHVAARIRELKRLQTQLKTLRDQCGVAQDTAKCAILDELSQAGVVPQPAARHSTGHVGGAHSGKRRS